MSGEHVLQIRSRCEFRKWLSEHCATEKECWIVVKRGRPTDKEHFWYIDAVEEALCFGWIDSTIRYVNGVATQRFSPRRKNSPWTELNKERCRRLEALGLMTDAGRAVLPDMDVRSFRFDEDVVAALKKARVWKKFQQFPPLYQRIRVYNIAFAKNRYPLSYSRSLAHLIEETKRGEMYGEWNDYGRLLDGKYCR